MSCCTDVCVKPNVGTNQCHCAVCHYSFASVGGFDSHRRDGRCLCPAGLGMQPNECGFWRVPMPAESRERFEQLRGGA